MEQTYTAQQMAQIVADYERLTTSHRQAQQRYYQKKADERKAYARMYYEKNKERILNRIAETRAPVNPA